MKSKICVSSILSNNKTLYRCQYVDLSDIFENLFKHINSICVEKMAQYFKRNKVMKSLYKCTKIKSIG